MAGDMRRALARRMMKKQLAADVQKIDDKNSRSVSKGKKYFFFSGFGTKGQEVARGKLSPPRPWIHLISSRPSSTPCPTPSGLAVGWVYVEIEDLSSHVDIFQREKTNRAPFSRLKNNKKKSSSFPLFPHSGGKIISPAVSWKQSFWKKTFKVRVPIVIGDCVLWYWRTIA